MRFELGTRVEGDLADLTEYMLRETPNHAERLLNAIERKFAWIAKHPYLHRLRPEYGTDFRLAPIESFVIIYKIATNTVFIERVLHGRRDLRAHFNQT